MRTFCQINSTANMTQCINPPHTCSSLCSQHPTQQMDYGVFNRLLGREVGEEFWGTRTQHIGASNPFAPKSFIGTSFVMIHGAVISQLTPSLPILSSSDLVMLSWRCRVSRPHRPCIPGNV